ncbi:hypothetical protein N7495_009516 [Penicillium taxi]|uniref:uncharacterized protein n=1 Tax=Penicillium taxi TaxID=168475 RepID=UPI00254578BD|nr:uncharacterized protein N7495_009516 [Penicillium taxi]KAJ5885006.1 hypothetical protein N7495_009516 [Penicillium taxi]
MPQIPTPPESRSGSPPEGERKTETTESEASELLQSLDTLLEQYLHLLDRQQQLQAGLAKQLSSGFLSLAHANYTCPPGRRYGADYYDERMKATRQMYGTPRWHVSTTTNLKFHRIIQHSHYLDDGECDKQDEAVKSDKDEEGYEYAFRVESISKPRSEEADQEDSEQTTNQAEDAQKANNPATTEIEIEIEKDSLVPQGTDPDPSSKSQKNNKKSRKFLSDDPIHWYGILVPQSLRTAQKSFTDAVQSHVSELAGAVLEMRALEKKITEIRTKL